MLRILRQPYPLLEGNRQKAATSLLVGIFVYIFLRIFQPFGLYNFEAPDKEIIIAGYGILSASISAVHLIILPLLLPRVYDEQRWKVWHEITAILFILLTISAANSVYSIQAGLFPWHPRVFTGFTGITLMVGFFPVTASIIAKQFWLMRRNLAQARSLQLSLDNNLTAFNQAEENTKAPLPDTIVFPAENGKDHLKLEASAILYLTSADNYIEIHCLAEGNVHRHLFRHTLKQAEEILAMYPSFFRCHRAYIINMDAVTGVEGNAQGYRLRLAGTNDCIPVARSMNAALKDRMSR